MFDHGLDVVRLYVKCCSQYPQSIVFIGYKPISTSLVTCSCSFHPHHPLIDINIYFVHSEIHPYLANRSPICHFHMNAFHWGYKDISSHNFFISISQFLYFSQLTRQSLRETPKSTCHSTSCRTSLHTKFPIFPKLSLSTQETHNTERHRNIPTQITTTHLQHNHTPILDTHT